MIHINRKVIALLLIISLPGLHVQGQVKDIDSTEVTVSVKNATLSGTIFSPAGKKNTPVVLIIAGSGPTDRNGNSPLLKGKNNSLLQVAEILAHNGISSLRYDKRGIGQSKLKPGITEDSILFSDMVNDAAAFYFLLKKSGYKKIFIAGHSEGSLIGMVVARKVIPAGYISIAGVGRKAADILKEQLSSLPEDLKKESYRDLDSLQNGFRIKKVNPQLVSLFRPSVQPYMISWFSYDPVKIISTLRCRMLILQGTNDIQVSEKDALALKDAAPKAKIVLIKNMNHIMKEVVSGNRNDNISSYSNPDLPVMKELTDEMINFIKRKKYN
jgi:pimeloyl-ACP methyl ester carboxylesterase